MAHVRDKIALGGVGPLRFGAGGSHLPVIFDKVRHRLPQTRLFFPALANVGSHQTDRRRGVGREGAEGQLQRHGAFVGGTESDLAGAAAGATCLQQIVKRRVIRGRDKRREGAANDSFQRPLQQAGKPAIAIEN